MSGNASTPGTSSGISPSDQVIIWQTLASKRAALDAMMWQTPALGMTAQAFLFNLALSPGSSRWARLIVAFLSLSLSLMVMQLMAKHRRHEMLDSLLLDRFEATSGIPELLGVTPHGSPALRPEEDQMLVNRRLRRSTPGPRKFWKMSSYELWMLGLALFVCVAVAILVLATLGVDGRVLGSA